MAITINGTANTIAGLAVGGLPDGTVDNDSLANTTITASKIAADTITASQIAANAVGDSELNAATGKLLQVVSTARLQSGSSGVTSWTTLAAGDGNVEVSITPSAATSKVLVSVWMVGFNDDDNESYHFRLTRGGTAIGVGAAAGSRTQSSFTVGSYGAGSLPWRHASIEYLDSPNTTSATTYALQGLRGSAGTFYFGRNDTDADLAQTGRCPTIITAKEVAA